MDEATKRARFRALVLPHLDAAYNLARWLTGNATDAEDVVQDSYLRAYSYYDPAGVDNPRAWMLAIVRRTAYTWLRRNRLAELTLVEDPSAIVPDPAAGCTAATPEALLIAKDETARLNAALARLPPEFREAIVLRELHGLAYKEIAAVVDVPIGTVMSRLARARRLLLRHLGTGAP